MSTDGQGTQRRRNIAENFNCLSRAHERYRRQTDRHTDRRQTDGRAIAYSEREREFTFAKNHKIVGDASSVGDALIGDGGRGRHTLRCQPASQKQTLSGTGVRVYTAHSGWLGVVKCDQLGAF